MTQHCPSCSSKALGPSGSKQSEVLILGDYPGKLELQFGKPFVSVRNSQSAGAVLRKEISLHGVDLIQFRMGYMWLHEPNKDENCFAVGLDVSLTEAKGKKAILLIGADTVSYFTGYKVSDVNGLQVESPMLSAPIIYACVNPSIVFHKTVGELRFALTNFLDHIQEENLV